MLVLSRKKDEKILIDNGRIVITVIELRGDKVRIGIHAPPEIDIHREEVFNAIQREREKEQAVPAN